PPPYDLGQTELCIRGADPVVAGGRELRTATDGIALNCHDHRLRGGRDRAEHAHAEIDSLANGTLGRMRGAEPCGGGPPGEPPRRVAKEEWSQLQEVGAEAEVGAGPRDHGAVHATVRDDPRHDGAETLQRFTIERRAAPSAVEADDCDPVPLLVRGGG